MNLQRRKQRIYYESVFRILDIGTARIIVTIVLIVITTSLDGLQF